MRGRAGNYLIEPYLPTHDPVFGRQRTVLVSGRRGDLWVFKLKPPGNRYLESAPIRSRGEMPDFSAEFPPLDALQYPDIHAALAYGGSMGGGSAAQSSSTQVQTPTSVFFTINGSTSPPQIIGFPHNIALSAVVTFLGGAHAPATPGQSVQFFATLFPNPTFMFDTETLTGVLPPFTAANPAFNINAGNGFASGNVYLVRAFYPGDALNLSSFSNTVSLNIAGS